MCSAHLLKTRTPGGGICAGAVPMVLPIINWLISQEIFWLLARNPSFSIILLHPKEIYKELVFLQKYVYIFPVENKHFFFFFFSF